MKRLDGGTRRFVVAGILLALVLLLATLFATTSKYHGLGHVGQKKGKDGAHPNAGRDDHAQHDSKNKGKKHPDFEVAPPEIPAGMPFIIEASPDRVTPGGTMTIKALNFDPADVVVSVSDLRVVPSSFPAANLIELQVPEMIVAGSKHLAISSRGQTSNFLKVQVIPEMLTVSPQAGLPASRILVSARGLSDIPSENSIQVRAAGTTLETITAQNVARSEGFLRQSEFILPWNICDQQVELVLVVLGNESAPLPFNLISFRSEAERLCSKIAAAFAGTPSEGAGVQLANRVSPTPIPVVVPCENIVQLFAQGRIGEAVELLSQVVDQLLALQQQTGVSVLDCVRGLALYGEAMVRMLLCSILSERNVLSALSDPSRVDAERLTQINAAIPTVSSNLDSAVNLIKAKAFVAAIQFLKVAGAAIHPAPGQAAFAAAGLFARDAQFDKFTDIDGQDIKSGQNALNVRTKATRMAFDTQTLAVTRTDRAEIIYTLKQAQRVFIALVWKSSAQEDLYK